MACIQLLHLMLHMLLLHLMLLSVPTGGKYVFITDRRSRNGARNYCRRHYIDLAPVQSDNDQRQLRSLLDTDKFNDYIWIGLERDDHEGWRWAGGGEVTTFYWDQGQPNDANEPYGLTKMSLWHDAGGAMQQPFFCFHATVVSQQHSWEEALEYCREHHRDLASVSSATEAKLIGKKARQQSGELFWIGLRFLAGHWVWTDGQPLTYWGIDGESQCPHSKMVCGALRVNGGETWEARDCEEQLQSVCY